MIGFVASSPYFGGDGEIAPNFAKIWRCPHSSTCRNQTVQLTKIGKYYFKRDKHPTVWWKICKSSFPNFGGSMATHCTGFSSDRRYQVGGLLLEQLTPWVELGDFQAKPKCRGRDWKAHLTMALSFCEVLGGLCRQGTALSLTGPEVLGSR